MNCRLRSPIAAKTPGVLLPRARRAVKHACARSSPRHPAFSLLSTPSLRAFMNNAGQESARQKISRLRRSNDGPLFRSFSLRSASLKCLKQTKNRSRIDARLAPPASAAQTPSAPSVRQDSCRYSHRRPSRCESISIGVPFQSGARTNHIGNFQARIRCPQAWTFNRSFP